MKNQILRSLCVQEKIAPFANTQPFPNSKLNQKVCLRLELHNWTNRKQ